MKKIICLILSFVMTVSLFAVNALALETDEHHMNIYGVYLTNEGDCTFVESEGHWLIIDTGLDASSDELLQKVNYYGIEEADVMISHLHTDHTGGFSELANSDIKINTVYLPDASLTPDDEYTNSKQNSIRYSAENNNPDVVITELKKGDTFSFGSVEAEVLGPVGNYTVADFEGTDKQKPVEQYDNCRSLVVRFDCGASSFLTAGDIEKKEESALVEYYNGTNKLDVDIMKLSHHALHTSNSEEFLAKVTPKFSYALNSNKIITDGSNYRMYYTSCKNASKYGPVYLVGDENTDFRASVSDENIEIYKGTEKLSGLVTLHGGDGTVVMTNMYYITGSDVKEGVYTIGGNKYYVFDGGLVYKAFYSFDLGRYVYRYEPVENGDVRYFYENGVMYTGFHKLNDNYFYFDTNTGVMIKGDKNWTPVKIGSKKYAINENGAVYNYAAKSGALKKYGSNYRYFDKNGVMKTGWLTVSGKKYYFDPTTGYRSVGLKVIDGKTYYFVEVNNAGYAYISKWRNFDSVYRYFNENGECTLSGNFVKYASKYIKLSATKFTYNGKEQKPSVKIYDANGKTISSKYYDVTYSKGLKKVGTYTATIRFKKKYSGSKSINFKIIPTATSIKKLSPGIKKLKATITKKSKQVTGYQIYYSTSKSFKTYKTKIISSYKTTTATLKELTAKTKYYVKVRTYKTVNGTKYYSKWSSVVQAQTK